MKRILALVVLPILFAACAKPAEIAETPSADSSSTAMPWQMSTSASVSRASTKPSVPLLGSCRPRASSTSTMCNEEGYTIELPGAWVRTTATSFAQAQFRQVIKYDRADGLYFYVGMGPRGEGHGPDSTDFWRVMPAGNRLKLWECGSGCTYGKGFKNPDPLCDPSGGPSCDLTSHQQGRYTAHAMVKDSADSTEAVNGTVYVFFFGSVKPGKVDKNVFADILTHGLCFK